MDHYTRSFPTDAQQAPGTGDRDPPDFLAFLVEANLLPLATYLQLQNRALDGKASESDTLISLGLHRTNPFGPIARRTFGGRLY